MPGIVCPKCSHRKWKVIYTRDIPAGGLKRRRACKKCGHRITTGELPISQLHMRNDSPKSAA